MDVVIAGGHGKIGRRLSRRLSARGDRVRGLVRNPDHEADLREDGAEAVVCDLERAEAGEVAAAIEGADAVVFAAGAGAGSGAARKLTMDRDGAVKLARAAEAAGASRYVMVSSVGAEDPPAGDDVFSVYLRAKAEADAALAETRLDWTIVRPGRLLDDPGTGRVRVDLEPHRAEVPRDDVSAILEALLHDVDARGRILYVNAGDEPPRRAIAAAVGGDSGRRSP